MPSARSFAPLLLLLLAAPTACTALGEDPSDEESDVEQGESEINGTTKGSATGSRFAKANASYMPSRSIATLEAVGALDDDMRATLKRADGIIAAEPSDGKVSLAELLRLEAPEFERVLLPSEAAGRARAWRLFEAPTNASPAYLPPVGPLATVKKVTREVGKIDRSKSLPLSTISDDVALVRVEQAYDSDGKKTTISMKDCDAALAAPAPFTPEEIAAIRAARDTIGRKLTVTGTARIEVESPKEESKAIKTIAGVRIRHVRKTSYVDVRQLGVDGKLTDAWLTAGRHSAVRFDKIPADAKLVTIHISPGSRPNTTTAEDSVVASNATDRATGVALPAGTYDLVGGDAIVEIWRGGTRRSAIALGPTPMNGDEQIGEGLNDYVDFELVANGKALVKNAVWADPSHKEIRFAYETTAAAPSGGATVADVTATATRAHGFALGTYVDPTGSFADEFDILSDKIIFHRSMIKPSPYLPPVEESKRMRPSTFDFNGQTYPAFLDDRFVVLLPSGMLLVNQRDHGHPPFDLDAAYRE